MKKILTKKVLIWLSVLFLLTGSLIYAVSIDPWKFVATLRIQEIDLYYRLTQADRDYQKNDIVKAWLKNEWKENWVLYIRPIDASGDFNDETNNVVTQPEKASIIWGYENVNNWDETTMILWWNNNTVDWEWIVLLWWASNTAMVDNAVILWSANSVVWSSNWVIMAANGAKNYGQNSTAMWGWNIATWANNSFTIAWGTINHQWVFSYSSASSTKPNIVQLNGWEWLIVKWLKPNWENKIKLTVNGAIAMWYWKCSYDMIGSIYYVPGESRDHKPAYCLCACVATWVNLATSIALSNQPYCDDLCESDWAKPLWMPKCWSRWFSGATFVYEYWETNWRTASKFCADNRTPIGYKVYLPGNKNNPIKSETCAHNEVSSRCEPDFLEPGQMVSRICPWVWMNDEIECNAYRRAEPPQPAVCGQNAKRYLVYEQKYSGNSMSDFCKWDNAGGTRNPSTDGTVVWWKKVTPSMLEEWDFGTYITWEILGANLANNFFPDPGWRVYWICETENSTVEGIAEAETSQVECFADRLTCNHCAKAWFPYCFDVDFSEDCAEWIGACLPWSDNAWENHPIHVSWFDTGTSDTLRAKASNTSITYHDDGISAIISEWKTNYYFTKNPDKTKERVFKVHFETKDGSYCTGWDTYIYQCQKWYTWSKSEYKCKPDECTWKKDPYSVPANNKELEYSKDAFLTNNEDDYDKACAYRCAKQGETMVNGEIADKDYSFLWKWWNEDTPYCAACAPWSEMVELWICEFTDPSFCVEPYKWFPNIEEWKCALPGSCYWIDTGEMVQTLDDIIPVANQYNESLPWSCVTDEAILDENKNQCLYTCKEEYLCQNGHCVSPSCAPMWTSDWKELETYITNGKLYREAAWAGNLYDMYKYKNYAAFTATDRYRDLNPSLETNASWHKFSYDVNKEWVVAVRNPSLYWEQWFYVSAPNEEKFREKVDWLAWCFYWCTWDDLWMDIVDGKYIEYNCKYEKSNPGGWSQWNHDGPSPKIKNLCNGSVPVNWKYGSYDYSFDVWLEETYKNTPVANWVRDEYPNIHPNTPCHFRCNEGYTYESSAADGRPYCWKTCLSWEYALDHLCMKCDPWYQPTTEKDIHWNPIGCWKKCSATEYVYNGYCYPCGSGKMWDKEDVDSHWNAKSCKNICKDDETYWTNRPGKTDCWTDASGNPVANCCLATFINATNRCTQGDSACHAEWTKCICQIKL